MTFAEVSESTGGAPRPHTAAASPRRAATGSEHAPGPVTGTVAGEATRCEPTSLSDDAWVRSQRVTVLMATYNRAHYIEEALDSLLQQSRAPDEVIVVDDGSTDDTRERVRRYSGRVRYLSQTNCGRSTAINRGLKDASGDWIWIFDDDDAAVRDGLEKLLYALAKQRDADFAYGGQLTGSNGDDGRIVPGKAVLPPDVPSSSLFGRSLRNIPFLLPAALVRRERFTALRFDEGYPRSADYEFLLRLLVDARGVRVPQPIFIWRSHDGPRGPAHARHEGALRERVWMEVGGRLGRDLRRRLPLASYLPRSDGKNVLCSRNLRRAVLERMTVMASKGLVREMLVDLHSAANLDHVDTAVALDEDEARACRDVGNLPFFQMRLLDAPDRLVTRLLAAAAGSRAGKAILAQIARGMLHAARRADRAASERRVLFRCALRLFRGCGPIAGAIAYLPARPR